MQIKKERAEKTDEYTELLKAISDVRDAIAWCDESAKNAARCACLADSAAKALAEKNSIVHPFSLPAGSLVPFAGENLPQGFFACNGASLCKKIYSELFSTIGYRYSDERDREFFGLPKIYGDRFVWTIARGKLDIEYTDKGLFFYLDAIYNLKKGKNPGADCWEELCGEISLSLSKEEICFGTLSQKNMYIIMENIKKAVTVEIVSLNGSHAFLNRRENKSYFYNGESAPYKAMRVEEALYLRPLAVRLYNRPLDVDEISAHAKTDRLRFFKTYSPPKREGR